MIWPISTLTDPSAPKGKYFLTALACAVIPAWVISGILQLVLDPALLEEVNNAVLTDELPFPVLAFLIVVFAPITETAIMVLIFWITRKIGLPPAAQVAVQVVLWAIAHGLQAFAWAFAPAWLFFIFSIVWLTQRKNSASAAFWMTSLVHGANNAIPMTILGIQTFTA